MRAKVYVIHWLRRPRKIVDVYVSRPSHQILHFFYVTKYNRFIFLLRLSHYYLRLFIVYVLLLNANYFAKFLIHLQLISLGLAFELSNNA